MQGGSKGCWAWVVVGAWAVVGLGGCWGLGSCWLGQLLAWAEAEAVESVSECGSCFDGGVNIQCPSNYCPVFISIGVTFLGVYKSIK